jgi:hypothetical protein
MSLSVNFPFPPLGQLVVIHKDVTSVRLESIFRERIFTLELYSHIFARVINI